MGYYDHRRHAGNAGDVWKHFLLCEAAGFLISGGRHEICADSANGRPDSVRGEKIAAGRNPIDHCLVYAESHAGRPDYMLSGPGEWAAGIGRILPLLPSLRDFFYFDILADLNTRTSLDSVLYPGSARLIIELAQKNSADLVAELWDRDSEVEASWMAYSKGAPAGKNGRLSDAVQFHRGNGFSGVLSWLDRSPPGLLLIDPPYVDPGDIMLAEKLLHSARDRGWIVLWWYAVDSRTLPVQSGSSFVSSNSPSSSPSSSPSFPASCPSSIFPKNNGMDGLAELKLQFADAGMDAGRMVGAVVALAGTDADNDIFADLLDHLQLKIARLMKILKLHKNQN